MSIVNEIHNEKRLRRVVFDGLIISTINLYLITIFAFHHIIVSYDYVFPIDITDIQVCYFGLRRRYEIDFIIILESNHP